MATEQFAIRRFAELAEKFELSSDWNFGFDRASRRNGQCNYSTQTITVSRVLLPGRTESEVTQTIIHEIAHALVGPGHNHNRVWFLKARSMGYRGGRCSSNSAESRQRVNEIQESLKKVVANCPKRNKIVHNQKRMPRNVHLKIFRHTCGPP